MAERKRGRSPFRVRTQRERKRVSSAKRPAVGASMSPRSSQTQNVEPSRIVSGTDLTILTGQDCLKRLWGSDRPHGCHGGAELEEGSIEYGRLPGGRGRSL